MSAGAFERRARYLIKTKVLKYVLVDKLKFYSFDQSVPVEASKLLLMKTGLRVADENIARMKNLFQKMPLNDKAEFATSCVLSVWANIFDVIKYHVDHNPKVITKLRLQVQYQQKLKEIYDIVRSDPDHEILEFFIDAKCRPHPNQLREGEFDDFLDMRHFGSVLDKSLQS